MRAFLPILFAVFCLILLARGRPEEARDVAELRDDVNDIQKAVQLFGAVIGKVLDLTGNPLASLAISHFTDVIVKLTANKAKDMWTAIEERLESRIESKITHNHFGTLVSKIKKLQAFMQPQAALTKKDLDVHIMTMKDQFLPQTFSFTSYNSKWATALPAYLTYMTAAHLELIQNKKIERCSLAKELQVIREQTVQAAKAMFRARYRHLNGIKSYKAWPNYPCTGGQCAQTYWLSFEDPATGKTYSEPLSKVSGIFADIEADTVEFVWKQLVTKVNFFFTKEVCLCENLCPKPIQRSEILFRYPSACFGKTDQKGATCTLPCHAYDEGYKWCPLFRNGRVPSNSLLFDYWDYCTKDESFVTCMPVKGTSVFEDVPSQ